MVGTANKIFVVAGRLDKLRTMRIMATCANVNIAGMNGISVRRAIRHAAQTASAGIGEVSNDRHYHLILAGLFRNGSDAWFNSCR